MSPCIVFPYCRNSTSGFIYSFFTLSTYFTFRAFSQSVHTNEITATGSIMKIKSYMIYYIYMHERMFQSHKNSLFKLVCEKITSAPVHITTFPTAWLQDKLCSFLLELLFQFSLLSSALLELPHFLPTFSLNHILIIFWRFLLPTSYWSGCFISSNNTRVPRTFESIIHTHSLFLSPSFSIVCA